MTNPTNRIPEPILPEHQLLRDVASMPQLSAGLRQRVVSDVRRNIRYGRWADRLRIAAAVLAAALMVCLVWHFRWTGQEHVAEQASETLVPMTPPTNSYSANGSLPSTPAPVAVPQGGPSNRTEMKEMQQLNQLIEDIQGRNNVLCGVLPIL